MKKKTAKQIALETLDRINRSLDNDENAILASAGEKTTPEWEYISLVDRILELTEP